MYKAAVRWMIRRNISKLNAGDYGPALAMYADDVEFSFPGDNSWADEFRPFEAGRQASVTHRGKDEMERFLQRFTAAGIRMEVEDILVNGPPWHLRAAVRAHVWSPGPDGDRYANRAVLFVTAAWGKLHTHEDYEDTARSAAFDAQLRDEQGAAEPPSSVVSPDPGRSTGSSSAA
jgi:ketosteroid isomerase-like protein